MNLDDFRCMRSGRALAMVDPATRNILAPIESRNGKNNKALLMLHGFSSTPGVYRQVSNQLIGYDAIIAPMLPGHGADLYTFSETKGEDWVNYVTTLCSSLIEEFKQLDVLGLSLGGLLACHLVNQFKLHHLYLLAPALDLEPKLEFIMSFAKLLKTLGFISARNSAGNLFTPGNCEIVYRQIPLTCVIEIYQLVKNFAFSIPNCPTDIFLGAHDQVVDNKRIIERFKNTENVHIHNLNNSAHVLPLDGNIKQIIERINQYNTAV